MRTIIHFATTIIISSFLSLQIFAADAFKDELERDNNIVSILYFPNRGILHGHFKLEIEGIALGWFQGRETISSLPKLIKSLEERGGRPFFRFIIPVTSQTFKDLREHAHETEACLCTRGVFATLAKYGGPKIPLILQFSPLLCGAYCFTAHFFSSDTVEKIEVYASSSSNMVGSCLMGMGGEILLMVLVPLVVSNSCALF